MVAGIAHALAVAFQGIQLVFVKFLAVKKQTAYQGGLSVIHRTGCQKTEQVFLFVLVQKGFYI